MCSGTDPLVKTRLPVQVDGSTVSLQWSIRFPALQHSSESAETDKTSFIGFGTENEAIPGYPVRSACSRPIFPRLWMKPYERQPCLQTGLFVPADVYLFNGYTRGQEASHQAVIESWKQAINDRSGAKCHPININGDETYRCDRTAPRRMAVYARHTRAFNHMISGN